MLGSRYCVLIQALCEGVSYFAGARNVRFLT